MYATVSFKSVVCFFKLITKFLLFRHFDYQLWLKKKYSTLFAKVLQTVYVKTMHWLNTIFEIVNV